MRARIAVLAAAAAVLAGCGGDDEPARDVTVEKSPRVIVRGAGGGVFDARAVYERAAPGVVTVLSVFEDSLVGPTGGQGSGFVLNKDGEIVTNAHVVSDGQSGNLEEASRVFVEFSSRDRVPAEVVGLDPFSDVALLKVEPDGLPLVPLELGDEAEIQVGAPVAAIGSPFGENQSLSVGVVSATHRAIRSLTEFQIDEAIQTDASINPGNSGGPLLDAEGRVIGINQQIETRSGSNEGVGFAVPISAIRQSVAELRADGEAEYPYIGVSSQALYPQLADRLGLDSEFGGLVAEVVPNGPADDAGLQGGDHKIQFQAGRYTTGGDVILSVDGKRVVRPDDLARLIAAHTPGDQVTLEILRDGDRRQVEVTLGVRPTSIPNG